MMKKIIGEVLIVAFMMVTMVLTVTASENMENGEQIADGITEYESGFYRYVLDERNGEVYATIVKYTNSVSLTATIPESINGYKVRIIAPLAFNNCELKNIIIPEGVTDVQIEAFRGCTVSNITIPASVIAIHEKAFRNVKGEVTLIVPYESVAYRYAIDNGMKYELNTYPEFVVDNVLVRFKDPSFVNGNMELKVNVITEGKSFEEITKDIEEEVVLYEVFFVEDGEIIQPEGLLSVQIELPDNINGKYASIYEVKNDNTLMQMSIQDDVDGMQQKKWFLVNSLGRYLAVDGHVNGDVANDFVIENGVLKEYLCSDKVVIIPEGVERIASTCNLKNAKEIVLPKSMKKIDMVNFYYSSIEKINVTDSIEVEDQAFQFCYGLRDEQGLVIVNHVLYDAQYFDSRGKSGELTIPEGVTTISSMAFHEVWGINKIILPKTIQTLRPHAFGHCTYLNNVELPEGLEFIGEGAFLHTSITNIVIPESVTTIEPNALVGRNNELIVIYGKKGSIAEKYANTYGNIFYSIDDFQMEKGVLVEYLGNSETVIVPSGITTIQTGAFYDYADPNKCLVKHVVLPEDVTTIKNGAFMRRYLESVRIPDSIEVIEENAFEYDPPLGWEVETDPISMPITIYGKTLTVAESYATEHGDTFIPTNDQLPGDVNGNGAYEAEDALGILRMIVKLEPMYGYSADADQDGEVGADDALKVLRKVVTLE